MERVEKLEEETSAPSPRSGLARNALLVGSLVLLSRITGLLREATRSRLLGTGMPSDAFSVAYLLPNLFRRLVGEGAVSSAYVAVHSHHTHKASREETNAFSERFITLWLFVAGTITVLGVLLSGYLLQLMAHGRADDPEILGLTSRISRVVFWYLLLVSMVAAFQGVLQARGVFGMPAFVSTMFNLGVVASAWTLAYWLPPEQTVYAMAFAILVGGTLQLVFLLPPVWRQGIRLRLRSPFGDAGIREVLRLLVPIVLAGGVYQINTTLSVMLAWTLEVGSVSSLTYSNRLLEFVLGVYVIALSTVSLTSLSRSAAAGNQEEFSQTASQVIGMVVFITIPAAVGLYLLRDPVIKLIFQGGEFQERSLQMTSAAFHWHIFGLVAIGICRVLTSAFFAVKNVRTPLFHAVWNVPVNLGLAYVLAKPMGMGHTGIALAATIAVALQMVVLIASYHRHMPRLAWHPLILTALGSGVAAAVMGVGCYLLREYWPAPGGKLALAGWLSVVIPSGAAMFFAVAALVRVQEVGWMMRRLRRRGA